MTKQAVVTGGARRIGRAIAEHLHRDGFNIALHYHNSDAEARSLAQQLCELRPDSCHCFQADLASLPAIRAMAERIGERYPGLDLLVNNASGFLPTPIDTCRPEEFDAMLDSNLKGPYFLTQALLPGLRQAGGSIVNIIDVHVDRPLPGYNAYGAAKAGLASLTRSLAVELGPDIRVNGIAPGAILWPDGGNAYDEQTREATIRNTPLDRMGDPSDIATTVSFLATDAPFITGQVIAVDGGRGLVAQ